MLSCSDLDGDYYNVTHKKFKSQQFIIVEKFLDKTIVVIDQLKI